MKGQKKAVVKESESVPIKQEDNEVSFLVRLTTIKIENFGDIALIALIRVFQSVYMTYNFMFPDEYWQGTEIAYHFVYGGVQQTWEWYDQYRLRNVIWPAFLSIPLWILKYLGLDTYYNVRLAPYMLNCILVIVGDYFFYQMAKRYFGKQTARISTLLYMTNSIFNAYLIRCFTNGFEVVVDSIGFYLFFNIKNKLDKNLLGLAIILGMSLDIRNTIILGWPPILVMKMIYENAYWNFIKSALFGALPAFALMVFFDSCYYGSLTLTLYNFFWINVGENRSVYFGLHRFGQYIEDDIPNFLPQLVFLIIPAALYNIYVCFRKREAPYILIFLSIYTYAISHQGHKEERYALPIFPFLFLILGQFLNALSKLKVVGQLVVLYLMYYSIMQVRTMIEICNFRNPYWQPLQHIRDTDPNPESVFHFCRYQVAFHSFMHTQPHEKPIKVYHTFTEPKFSWNYTDQAVQYSQNGCLQFISMQMQNGRVKYVIVPDHEFSLAGQQGEAVCMEEINENYDYVDQYPKHEDKWKQYFSWPNPNLRLFKRKESSKGSK